MAIAAIFETSQVRKGQTHMMVEELLKLLNELSEKIGKVRAELEQLEQQRTTLQGELNRVIRDDSLSDQESESTLNGAANTHNGDQADIDRLLRSPEFLNARDTKDRFLAILSWAHTCRPEEFGEIATKINKRGRIRKYFARSREDLEKSGHSVNAKEIPESTWWVVTNNDTKRKKDILRTVLVTLNYSAEMVEKLCGAIGDVNGPKAGIVSSRGGF
jgi:negative modulator of initiation of replication